MRDSVMPYMTSGQVLTALGFGVEEHLTRMMSGARGMRCDASGQLLAGGYPVGLLGTDAIPPTPNGYTRLERMLHMLVQSLLGSLPRSLDLGETLLVVATTKGNVRHLMEDEEVGRCRLHRMAQRVAEGLGFTHQPIVVSNACISGLSALILASRILQSGGYEHAIVAGVDELTPFIAEGFCGFRSLDSGACRPYDARREGLNLGEGGGVVLLTYDRELVTESVPVQLLGGAITNDANHISAPSRTGEELGQAIRLAMHEAGVTAEQVAFVNPHGTATRYNDEMESKALAHAGVDGRPILGMKGYIGHTLAASGMVECILAAEMLRRGEMVGTVGYEVSDLPVAIDVTSSPRRVEGDVCIKTASGFGGCNAAVVMSRGQGLEPLTRPEPKGVETVGRVTVEPGRIERNGLEWFHAETEGDFGRFLRDAHRVLSPNDERFARLDDLCKLGVVAAEVLLDGIAVEDGYRFAVLLGNEWGSEQSDKRHWQYLQEYGSASPSVFVYTLPSIVVGEICIRNGLKGDNTFVVAAESGLPELYGYARILLEQGYADYCMVGWCEAAGATPKADMRLLKRLNG